MEDDQRIAPETDVYNSDGEVDNKTRHKLKNEIITFCNQTTAHGMSHIGKEEAAKWYKMVWIVIIVGALLGNTLHLYFIVIAYLKYPSQEISELSPDLPRFPDVTVCDVNPINQMKADHISRDNSSSLVRFTSLLTSMASEIAELSNITGVRYHNIIQTVPVYYANLPQNEIEHLGNSLRDFIVRCTFMGRPCKMDSDWTMLVHPAFLNCFTFSPPVTSPTMNLGPEDGLSLTLSFDNEIDGHYIQEWEADIYSNMRNALGARITVHEHGTYPMIHSMGIDVPPGLSSSIALRMTTVEKLGYPHSRCASQMYLTEPKRYRYSTDACSFMCMNRYIYDMCNCHAGYLEMSTSNSESDRSHLCLYLDNNTVSLTEFANRSECQFRSERRFVKDKTIQTNCKCKEACNYVKYEKYISSSKWPAHQYMQKTLLNILEETSASGHIPLFNHHMSDILRNATNNPDDLDTLYYFERLVYSNFARVNIYFEALEVLERKESRSMTLADLFAGIGGTIGLWAGLSIITLIEVVFFLSNLVRIKCKGKKK